MNEVSRPKILVVDDSKQNIDIVLELFASLEDKYSVMPALSSEKAIKIVNKHNFDLIKLNML